MNLFKQLLFLISLFDYCVGCDFTLPKILCCGKRNMVQAGKLKCLQMPDNNYQGYYLIENN